MAKGFTSGGTLKERSPDFDKVAKGDDDATSQGLFRIWDLVQGRVLRALDKLTYNVQLQWTRVPYASTNFTASSSTWGVDSADILDYRYVLIGNTMIIAWYIQQTDVGGTPAHLRLAIPGGYRVAAGVATNNLIRVSDAGAATAVGVAEVSAGEAYVRLFATVAGGAWATTAADNTTVIGEIVFDVERVI